MLRGYRDNWVINLLASAAAIGLLAIWVAYPLAIAVVRYIRRPFKPAPVQWPAASVVIASREPDDAICDRIENILRTHYPLDRLEVIVASSRQIELDPKVPDTATARVSVVRAQGLGKALALNAGVRSASGDVIVFADTYQRFDEDTIPRLVQAVLQPSVGAASGSLHLPPGTGTAVALYWAFESWLRNAESRLHSTVGATGAVWAVRRSLWQPLRPGLILDDVFSPMHIVLQGRRVVFVEDARAWELRTPTPAQEYRRKVRTLTGVLQLCAWLPAVLLPVRNPIWVQFTFHKLLRLATPYLLLILAVWLLASIARPADPRTLVLGGIASATVVVPVLLARWRWARRVRHVAVEALLIQYAVLVAGLNGLRGNWQVWDA